MFIQNKIQIDSFLLKRGVLIRELNGLEDNWQQFFHNMKHLTLKDLQDYFKEEDFYIEGALCIQIGKEKILSFREWDLVDQLWSYFLRAFSEIILRKVNHSEFYFPDQPLQVEITKMNKNDILLKVGNVSNTISILQFLPVFLNEAEFFFRKLSEIVGLSKYKEEFAMIEQLKSSSGIN